MDKPQTIEEAINKSVLGVAAMADMVPGVIIVQDLRDLRVLYMSPRGLDHLGITQEEVSTISNEEYNRRYFNVEDSKDYIPKLNAFLARNIPGEICTFFQQVRFNSYSDYNWYMSSAMVLLRDFEENPLLAITIAFPIDAMHHMAAKAQRLLEENNFLQRNFHNFSKLGKREREVLQHMALGKTAQETADVMFISLTTVETHRRNIKRKLNTNSSFDLNQYARSFDLI